MGVDCGLARFWYGILLSLVEWGKMGLLSIHEILE